MIPSRAASFFALAVTSVVALVLCPHSKVEESFNLQATHDLYYHGINPAVSSWTSLMLGASDKEAVQDVPYDHMKFPGVVPRTFTAPIVLAYVTRCIGAFVSPAVDLASHPMLVQFLTRFLLLLFNVHAFVRLADALDRFGEGGGGVGRSPLLGNYFLLVTACQFHLPFYCSRMLPNVFALGLVTNAYADWFDGRPKRSAGLLVAATAVFRCDVLILLFAVGLAMLIRKEMDVWEAIGVGVSTGAACLALTVPIDSLLWERPVWPEGEVLFFNTVENKSSEWGTSPWHWYISSAVPKSMLLTLILVPLSFVRVPEWLVLRERHIGKRGAGLPGRGISVELFDARLIPFVAPILLFLGLYSLLPHKEMRFIFPAIPMLNVAAAHGLTRLHQTAFPLKAVGKDKEETTSPWSFVALLLFVGGIGTVAITFMGSTTFLLVSRHNYPGGVALTALARHVAGLPQNQIQEGVRVYVDVASAMSGVSLFGQRAASSRTGEAATWAFEKGGYEEENKVSSHDLSRFTHLLSEEKEVDGFRAVNVAQGWPRVDFRNIRIATKEAIFVLEHDTRGR